MINLGIVNPGETLYIPFDSFGSDGESITLSGLAVTDIEIYKDGSTTQRASDNGYALLDTDGIDFDGLTGIHGFSIDLADNSTAGFYAAGSTYRVVVSSVTIDAQTVSFTAARFRIGYQGAILNTTIASLTNQTSFTLTAGPAEDDALNGQMLVIHDVASAVQKAVVLVSDYTGATKTVTLAAAPSFTVAATDNVSVLAVTPALPNAPPFTTGGLAGDDDLLAVKAKTDNLPSDPADASVVAGLIAGVETKVDTVDTVVDAIKVKTDNLPSDPADQSLIIAATTSIMDRLGAPGFLTIAGDIANLQSGVDDLATTVGVAGAGLTEAGGTGDQLTDVPAAILDLAAGVETGLTLRQALRLLVAAEASKLSGAATTTITIRNFGDSKNRITATVDADGNRSAITYDLT